MNITINDNPYFPVILIALLILERIIYKNNYPRIIDMIKNDHKKIKKGFFLFIINLIFFHAIYSIILFYIYIKTEDSLLLPFLLTTIFIASLCLRCGNFKKDIDSILDNKS